MEKYYQFAGVELEVSIPEQWMYQEERRLEVFRADRLQNPHRFRFELVEALTPPGGRIIASFPDYRVYEEGGAHVRYIGSVAQGWEHAYMRAEHSGKAHRVQMKAVEKIRGFGVQSVLNALETEHLVLEAGGVILHASFVEVQGKGILFTAPSQTGKSTQAELWRRFRGAGIINGDRAVMRLVAGVPLAAGLPFAGSSEYCENRTVPLAAIVCLRQAPATEIHPLRGIAAFRRVWEGCCVNTWNQDDLNRAVDIVRELISRVPVFELACTPDETAVTALEQALEGGNAI